MTGDPHCLTPAAELVALRSRVRELEAERDEAADARDMARQGWADAEQKLAAANALLSDALDALNQDAWPVLADGIRAHLAGQPAAPGGDVLSDGTWIRTPEEEGGQADD